MKKLLCTFCIITLVLSSCDFSSSLSEHLGYLMKMSKEFGGSWNGSTGNGCYKIEITNSERLNNNLDSIDYYGTIIGRNLIENLDLNYSCLTLDLINEKKVGLATQSNTSTISFDLEMINRFKDRSVEEYVIARKAIYACRNADNDDVTEAENWLSGIDTETKNPFVELAKAHIERAKGNTEESLSRINSLIEAYPTDDLLNQYIGFYFLKTNELDMALSLFKKAALINKDNMEHLMNVGEIYYEKGEYDSCAYYLTKVIDRDSLNLNALFSRAECRFNEKDNAKGCADIKRILEIAPNITIPDSILMKCDMVN